MSGAPPYAFLDYLKLFLEFVPALVLVSGLYQYRVNSRNDERKRSREKALEAANEVADFRADPHSEQAMRMIDYQNMTIQVKSATGEIATCPVSPEQFSKALRYHADEVGLQEGRKTESTEGPDNFTELHLRIRAVFDDFFSRLERIEALISAEIIDQRQFGDLFSYWLKLMGERPRPQDMSLAHFEDPQRRALWRYIRMYEFNGVVRLFRRYERAAALGVDSNAAFRPKNGGARVGSSSPDPE